MEERRVGGAERGGDGGIRLVTRRPDRVDARTLGPQVAQQSVVESVAGDRRQLLRYLSRIGRVHPYGVDGAEQPDRVAGVDGVQARPVHQTVGATVRFECQQRGR